MTRPALHLERAATLPEALLSEVGCPPSAVRDGWILRAGDELAGIASLRGEGADGRLELLYVTPAWRGLGYGSETVGALLDSARQQGLRRIRALAPKGNGLSVYFWFRQGFHPERADATGLTLVQELTPAL